MHNKGKNTKSIISQKQRITQKKLMDTKTPIIMLDLNWTLNKIDHN